MRRILFLAWAEVLHVVRDRATLAQVLIIPIVQLLVLSNAATFAIRDTPAYVVDLDRTPASRGLIGHFRGGGHFRVVAQSQSPALADRDLLEGHVTVVLTVPRGFERDLVREGAGTVQLVVNAEKGTAAGIVSYYANRILAGYAAEATRELRPNARTTRGPGEAPPVRGGGRIEVRARSWYNPTLDYKHYMVPGILVALVTLIGTLMTAQNIAREKELGTLEQLNVTPITRGQFIAAKLLPFWALGMFELGVGLLVGRLVFGVPAEGSLILLFAIAAIYLIGALGIGLWISTVVDTQQQAMFVTFFLMMIYLLMSGLYTPVDAMPRWVRWMAEGNPVKHFVLVARAILLKGAGPAEVAQPVAILIGFAMGVFALALRQHRKTSV